MLLVKFKKEGNARYLSQVDMQRVLNRAFRRAGIRPAYSGGFHPHMKLKMSPPPPLGLRSEAEYFVLELEKSISPAAFLETVRMSLPSGISVSMATETEKNPNIAGNAVAAKYRIESTADWARIADEIDTLRIPDKEGGGFQSAAEKVYAITPLSGGGAEAVLAYGGTNLRLDRFFLALNNRYGLNLTLNDAVKTALYLNGEGDKRSDADDLFPADCPHD